AGRCCAGRQRRAGRDGFLCCTTGTHYHHDKEGDIAMTTRRTLAKTLIGSALLAAFALPASAQIEIKLGHVGGPGSLFELSANEFARRANEKLGTKAKVVVFGSSQLGGDSELMQKLRLGTVELAIPSSVMSSAVDAFGMFE